MCGYVTRPLMTTAEARAEFAREHAPVVKQPAVEDGQVFQWAPIREGFLDGQCRDSAVLAVERGGPTGAGDRGWPDVSPTPGERCVSRGA